MPMDTYLASVTGGKVLFDKNGEIAAQGKVHEPLLSKLKKHPFFSKKPPKSAGREQFGGVWLRSQLKSFSKLPKEDVVSTLTEWVAWSMAHSYLSFCPKKEIPSHIYFCGGGALNLELLNRVQALLPQTRVQTTEALGWPVFAVEAGCFAYLAAARVMGYKWDLRHITGNPKPIPLGVIYEV
jgi:anhydro-N-acetylmuramic acid kinase